MKIISGNLKDKNIQINCECCHCTYEIESREDFKIHWVCKPVKVWCDPNIEIPEYSIVCPVCGRDIYIGLDEEDYEGVRILRNCFNEVIMSRSDWKSRYKVKPRVRGKVSSI